MKPSVFLRFEERVEFHGDVIAPVYRKYLQQWFVDDGSGGPAIKAEAGPEGSGWWQDVHMVKNYE